MARFFLFAATVLGACLVTNCVSHAKQYHWLGGSPFGNSWTDILNWENSDAPDSDGSDQIDFELPCLLCQTTSTVNVNHNINTIDIGSGNESATPSYTINGPGTLFIKGAITNWAHANQTISAPLRFDTAAAAINNTPSNAGIISLSSAININTSRLAIFAGANGIASNGSVSGAGSLDVFGSGTLTLRGNNNYSGGTNIIATLKAGADNVIPPGPILIQGKLDLDGHNETIGPGSVVATGLTMEDDAQIVDAGLLKIAALGTFIKCNSCNGAKISGGTFSLATSSTTREFEINDYSSANVELDISADIINAVNDPDSSTPVIRVTGGGRMKFSGDNTFWRSIHVEDGVLQALSPTALGNGVDTANTGTRVEPTSAGQEATLEITNNINIAAEHLTLTGLGVDGSGALHSLQGNNTWGGQIVLAGTTSIAVSSGSLTVDGVVSGGGQLRKTGPGTLLLNAENTNNNNLLIADGTLGGNGSAGGSVTVQAAGTLAPGASPEVFTVDSSINFQAGSTFAVELAGDGGVAGTDFDQLVIDGPATINGATLDVDLVAPFTPAAGNEFHILNYGGGISGTGFSAFDLPALDAGLRWITSDLLTTGILSVALNGDYNQDGKVDAADYALWRSDPDSFGGAQGYTNWVNNFGQTAGSGAGASANAPVPEPEGVLLLMLGAAFGISRRRRSASRVPTNLGA